MQYAYVYAFACCHGLSANGAIHNRSLYAGRHVRNGILYPHVYGFSCTQALLLQLAQVCMSWIFGTMGHRPQGAHGLMLCHDDLLQITHDRLNSHNHEIIMICRHQPRLMAHLGPNGAGEAHMVKVPCGLMYAVQV